MNCVQSNGFQTSVENATGISVLLLVGSDLRRTNRLSRGVGETGEF